MRHEEERRPCLHVPTGDQARDLVEVPNKPGDLGISLLRGLVPLVRAAGPEATRKGLPPAGAIALWSFYIGARAPAVVTPALRAPYGFAGHVAECGVPCEHVCTNAAYSGYILFSTSAPGAPAWAQPPELLMVGEGACSLAVLVAFGAV